MVLTAASNLLRDNLLTQTGIDAIYARGATTLAVSVVPGRTDTVGEDIEETVQEFKTDDWICSSDALSFFGEPAKGDTITIASGDLVGVYEVLPLVGESTHRYVGQARAMVRIHTVKKTATKRATEFDGVDDAIILPNPPASVFGTNYRSIECYIDIYEFDSSWNRLIWTQRANADDGEGLSIGAYVAGGVPETIRIGYGGGSYSASTTLAINTEYHVKIVVPDSANGSDIQCWIDGVQIATEARGDDQVINTVASTDGFVVGRRPEGSAAEGWFYGTMRDLYIKDANGLIVTSASGVDAESWGATSIEGSPTYVAL